MGTLQFIVKALRTSNLATKWGQQFVGIFLASRVAGAAWLYDIFDPLRVKQHRAPRWDQRSPCHPSFWPFSSHLFSQTGLPPPVWRVTLYTVCVISKRCIIQQRKTETKYINNSVRLLKVLHRSFSILSRISVLPDKLLYCRLKLL